MASNLSTKERQKIVDLLHEHGGNQNAVARMCGRHQTTVRRIAKAEGIESINAAPKNANEARTAHSLERRLDLIGRGFDKAQDLLDGIDDAAELQKWSVALGTLVDKARLETGQATDRKESSHRNLSSVPDKELDEFERILRNGS